MSKTYSTGAPVITGGTIATPGQQQISAPNNLAVGPKQLKRMTITVPISGIVPVMIAGDFCFVEQIIFQGANPYSTDPIFVQFDDAPEIQIAQRQTQIRSPFIFTKINLRNSSTTYAVTLIFVVGFGYYAQSDRPLWIRPFYTNITFTRPNNIVAYAANQLVSTVAGDAVRFVGVFDLGSQCSRITRARISKNSVTTANADFMLYLTQQGLALNAAGLADQTVFDQIYNSGAKGNGLIRFPTFITAGAGSNMAECVLDGLALLVWSDYARTGSDLWGYLVAQAAYVPTALEQFRLELWGEQL